MKEDGVRAEVERLCASVIALEREVPADEEMLVDHLVDARNALLGARSFFRNRDHDLRETFSGNRDGDGA